MKKKNMKNSKRILIIASSLLSMAVIEKTNAYAYEKQPATTNLNRILVAASTATPTPTPGSRTKEGYYGEDGTFYPSVGFLDTYAGLREDLENSFGRDMLLNDERNIETNMNLYEALLNCKEINDKPIENTLLTAITTSAGRKNLAKIAIDAGIIEKASQSAGGLVALYYYYGILGSENRLGAFDYKAYKPITREQACFVIGRYYAGSGAYSEYGGEGTTAYDLLGKDNPYVAYVHILHGYRASMFTIKTPGDTSEYSKTCLSAKELSSPMTRIEAIYMIVNKNYPSEIEKAISTKVTSASYFNDISEKTIVSNKILDASMAQQMEDGLESERSVTNMVSRAMLSKKLINRELDAVIEVAYNLGLIKPDAKGNANLFKNCTQKELIIMLSRTSIATNNGYTPDHMK